MHPVLHRLLPPLLVGVALQFTPLAGRASSIYFPPEYIEQQRGKHEYRVSAGLELAVILTAVAFKNSTIQYHPLRRKPSYYKEVIDHFSPFAEHPVFEAVGLDPDKLSGYVNLRNSSYRWRLCEEGWCQDAFLGRWSDRDTKDVFADQLALIADFAKVSGFEAFFEAQRPHYDAQTALYESRVNLGEIIRWLSREFDGQYDAYSVLFSPLILGNQATTGKLGQDFGQVFMIVDPPLQTEDMSRTLNSFKWVFTELDHHFVNPCSDQYANRIEEVFGDRRVWTAGGQSDGYRSALAIFNEYMTWAVYVLYVDDLFDGAIAQAHGGAVIEFMEQRRGFPLFGDFVARLRAERKATAGRISELYPALLRWAEKAATASG